MMWPWTFQPLRIDSSNLDGVALEAPIVTFRLFKHLPEGALPLAGLLILLLDPKCDLHHAARDIPIAPQGLNSLIIIARPRSLVEERAPSILVLADELDLLKRVFRLPLLDLLPDLADGGLRGHRHRKHPQGRQNFHLGHVILIALRGGVLGEDHLLAFLLSHRSDSPC